MSMAGVSKILFTAGGGQLLGYSFPTLGLDSSALAVLLLPYFLGIQEFKKQTGYNGGVSHVLIFTLGSCCLCKIQMKAMSSSLVPKFFSVEGSSSFMSTTDCIGRASPIPHS